MGTLSLRSQFHPLRCTGFINSASHPRFLFTIKATSCPNFSTSSPASTLHSKTTAIPGQALCSLKKPSQMNKPLNLEVAVKCQSTSSEVCPQGNTRFVIVGAVSLGLVLFLMGMDDQKALALGPEGPLMEEFWDNVRRYALYALTVSTGAIYTIFLPIFELLKNPISAVLILVIFAGGFFIVSQVLSAMFGVSDFTYDYGY